MCDFVVTISRCASAVPRFVAVLMLSAVFLSGLPRVASASNPPPEARALLLAGSAELEDVAVSLIQGQESIGTLQLERVSWEAEDFGARLASIEGTEVVVVHGGPFSLRVLQEERRRGKRAQKEQLAAYLETVTQALEQLGFAKTVLVSLQPPVPPKKKSRGFDLLGLALAGLEEECQSRPGCSVELERPLTESSDSGPPFRLNDELQRRLTDALLWVEVVVPISPWDEEGLLKEQTVLSEERLFTHESTLRGKSVRMWAFFPQAENPEDRFPVLYLLHGATGDYRDWRSHARKELLELASLYGLIIVTPDGDPFGWYLDSPLDSTSQLESYFLQELIPFVEEASGLPVALGAESRAVAGLSMGGHGALTLALRNPGTFRSASSMSGILDIVTHPKSWQIADRLGSLQEHSAAWEEHSARQLLLAEGSSDLPILFVCGDTDRAAWEENQALHQALVDSSRPHEWRQSSAGHSWEYWVSELPEHVGFAAEYLRGDGIRPKPSEVPDAQNEESEVAAPATSAPGVPPHEKRP